MGIATFDLQDNHVQTGGVPDDFIAYGQSNRSDRYEHEVSFFGNLYLNAAHDVRYEDEALTSIRKAALDAAMSNWDFPAYCAYLREIDALEPTLRSKLRLDPDQSFYWRYLHDELAVVANGEPRFRKVLACGRPVTYFGGFADPQSRSAALAAGWRLADVHLRYGGPLAAAFHRSRVSIDVTNAPFINGFTSKFLACFAAGGFVLTTRKADMTMVLGSLVDAIGFSSAEELAAKLDKYLTDDRQRIQVAQEIRELVRRHWSTSAVFARTVPLALEYVRARGAVPPVGRLTNHGKEVLTQKLGFHLFDIRLELFEFVEGSSGQFADGRLDFVSSRQRYAYSLCSALLGESCFYGEAVIRILANVSSGVLGFAITAGKDVSKFIVEFSVNSSARLQTIDIPVEDLGAVGSLVIRNQSGAGPSEATIRSVRVFRPEGYFMSNGR